MNDCGFTIFNECDGTNCTRDCSAKVELNPYAKRVIFWETVQAVSIGLLVGLTMLAVAGLAITTKDAWHRVEIAERAV